MANKAKHPNAESCISSSAYYDRPDHSFLSDIDLDFNYLNNIKELITSNYYNEIMIMISLIGHNVSVYSHLH